jgi:hypothetical protein
LRSDPQVGFDVEPCGLRPRKINGTVPKDLIGDMEVPSLGVSGLRNLHSDTAYEPAPHGGEGLATRGPRGQARQDLGADEYDAAYRDGASRSYEELVGYLLDTLEQLRRAAPAAADAPGG